MSECRFVPLDVDQKMPSVVVTYPASRVKPPTQLVAKILVGSRMETLTRSGVKLNVPVPEGLPSLSFKGTGDVKVSPQSVLRAYCIASRPPFVPLAMITTVHPMLSMSLLSALTLSQMLSRSQFVPLSSVRRSHASFEPASAKASQDVEFISAKW